MATEKVSLTLDRKALTEARARVGSRGLSAYVDAALRLRLQHDRIRGLLADLEAEHGPVSGRVSTEVQREWPSGNEPRPGRSRRG